jgi:hypothetical protein
MKAIHHLGYVSVFWDQDVYVYAEKDFPQECYFFDPEIDEEIWK